MVRIRDDKSVNSDDIRASQALERCAPQSLAEKAEALELPPSEVLRREAYAKTSKGKQAVRKLLVWKTNKQDISLPGLASVRCLIHGL